MKATFEDSSVLLLSPTAAAYTHIDSHGSVTTQLTEFVLSKFKRKLAAVLQFKHLHTPQPVYCAWLNTGEEVFKTHYRISEACWPADATAAIAAGFAAAQQDGSTVLESVEATAQLILHPSSCRLAVHYPLLLLAMKGEYTYTWHKQSFSVALCPPVWQPVCRLLLAAASVLSGSTDQANSQHMPAQASSTSPPGQQHMSAARADQHSVHVETALAAEWHTQMSHSEAAAAVDRTSPNGTELDGGSPPVIITLLPTALQPAESDAHVLRSMDRSSWWYACTDSLLPPDSSISFAWTPDALYQYLSDIQEVEVWLHTDQSCLVSCQAGRFFKHIQCCPKNGSGASGSSNVFAAAAVPQHVWAADQTTRIPLANIAHQAGCIRSATPSMDLTKVADDLVHNTQ